MRGRCCRSAPRAATLDSLGGMKTPAMALACVLVGCAMGAVMPKIAAQTFAPKPDAPRWEQFCSNVGSLGSTIEKRTATIQRINDTLAARGREGFELIQVPAGTTGKTGNGGSVWPELMLCFKRPL